MKLNKQSNIYTLIYIAALVILVGAILAGTSMALKDRQEANANADKMKQILSSVHISADDQNVHKLFEDLIVATPVIDSEGNIVAQNGFEINVQQQSKKKDASKRLLPVYVCNLGEKGIKYILPIYGNGLWGPIWGYIAVDSDGSTVYGAYFAHQSETPGLGAEIEKPKFSNQFDGKRLFKDDRFLPVTVIKKGQKAVKGEDYVDAVSGGTITSKGVAAMLDDCLKPYEAFLFNVANQRIKF